ncbi:hypothetical protein B9Z19DRAFT_1072560 [Tuber borchii]|uniref:Uncharacterized protein n=1 Tax=Tuber borchii TaxID=42251 RepID=A0A2T7A6R3_TUBBO|nr:hypothetical protein B9Z19DRAFT_1072560 [Tuber borchii]
MPAFYGIQSTHSQKGISIRPFPMALQSSLKGESLWQLDSRGVRHAIMKPFYDGVQRHPLCLPPKGLPHTSIFHGATESSEGGVHILGFLDVWKVLTLKPDSGGVRHAIAKPFYDGPFYDGILRHPICPPPKGRLHTSIFHGATEFSEEGALMAGVLSADFIARFLGR